MPSLSQLQELSSYNPSGGAAGSNGEAAGNNGNNDDDDDDPLALAEAGDEFAIEAGDLAVIGIIDKYQPAGTPATDSALAQFVPMPYVSAAVVVTGTCLSAGYSWQQWVVDTDCC